MFVHKELRPPLVSKSVIGACWGHEGFQVDCLVLEGPWKSSLLLVHYQTLKPSLDEKVADTYYVAPSGLIRAFQNFETCGL